MLTGVSLSLDDKQQLTFSQCQQLNTHYSHTCLYFTCRYCYSSRQIRRNWGTVREGKIDLSLSMIKILVVSTEKDERLVNRHDKCHIRVHGPHEWPVMPFNEVSKGYQWEWFLPLLNFNSMCSISWGHGRIFSWLFVQFYLNSVIYRPRNEILLIDPVGFHAQATEWTGRLFWKN